MPTFDASTATVVVDAFKEGLLSRAGHDVRLTVGSFEILVEEDRIEATFDPSSLKVLHAMKKGQPHHGALSDRDMATIEGYVRDDILECSRYRALRFEADELDLDDDVLEVEGQLSCHGETEELSFTAELRGDQWVAEVKLHQPTWGIRPFKALMGALKIKPGIVVTVTLPASAFDE
jgi:hypothetical protein